MKRKRNYRKRTKKQIDNKSEKQSKADIFVYACIALIGILGILLCFYLYKELWDLKPH